MQSGLDGGCECPVCRPDLHHIDEGGEAWFC